MQTTKNSAYTIIRINIAYTTGILLWVPLQIFFGDRWWLLYIANTLAIYLFLPLIGQLLSGLWLRQKTIWICFGTVLLIGGYYFGALFLPKSHNQTSAKSITVMTSNVLKTKENADAVIASIKKANADVVAIQELNPVIAKSIQEELIAEYPYQILEPSPSYDGMGLLSKYPLSPEDVVFSENWLVGIPQAYELDFDGEKILVINFHAIPPYESPEYFKLANNIRNDQVEELLSLIRKQEIPAIALGDLNATEKNEAYQLMTSQMFDTWREKGLGLGNTRINLVDYLPPKWLVRIDYVFHSQELETNTVEIGPWDGHSDHRPVVAELTLK